MPLLHQLMLYDAIIFVEWYTTLAKKGGARRRTYDNPPPPVLRFISRIVLDYESACASMKVLNYLNLSIFAITSPILVLFLVVETETWQLPL